MTRYCPCGEDHRVFNWQFPETRDGATLNLFVEPQGTVAHKGVAPKLQVFMGFNMQFSLKR